jgi:hypothetical protein
MLVRASSLSIAHETAGAACIRHSLRPPVFEGELYARPGRVAPREREVMSLGSALGLGHRFAAAGNCGLITLLL